MLLLLQGLKGSPPSVTFVLRSICSLQPDLPRLRNDMDCEIRASGSGSTTSKAADSHDHVGKFALKKQSNSKLRGRREDPPDVRFSKILSYILRHGATKEGLKVRTDGFVRVDELVRSPSAERHHLRDLNRFCRSTYESISSDAQN